MPFITELIIDKPPVFESMVSTKIELAEPTNKFISMHNELLKDMKLSPNCIKQIQTLLSEMHHLLSEELDKEKTGLPRRYAPRNDVLVNNSSFINVKNFNKSLELIDYKYVLFHYAYVTNQGDCIVNKWLEVDKDAEKYISKYFNIKFKKIID